MKNIYKQQARAVVLVLQKTQQQTVGILLVLTVILALLYIYFLGSAVVHAVERREAQSAIADTNSRIADLEVNYLRDKNSITLDLATNLGFEPISRKEYVERARYLGRADTR